MNTTNRITDPKTNRSCPKQLDNQTDEEYRKEVTDWVKENSSGWEGQDGDVNCWSWKGAFAPHSGGARYNNYAAHSFIFRICLIGIKVSTKNVRKKYSKTAFGYLRILNNKFFKGFAEEFQRTFQI
jgi:hypothetical protein